MAETPGPDSTTETVTPPVVEPTAVQTTAEADTAEFTELTDDQLHAVIDAEVSAARDLADPENAAQFDEAVFSARMERAARARNEIGARADRVAASQSARSRLGEFASTVPAPAARPAVPSVAQLPVTPADAPLPERRGVSFAMVVPSDVHGLVKGITPGGEYTSFSQIGDVLDERMRSVGRAGAGARSADLGLMQIQRTDANFTINADDPRQAMSVIDAVRSQSRLDGGDLITAWERSALRRAKGNERRVSLTAAAGWCAPSETYYNLCEMESLDGLIELPEATVSRGGVRWTQEPTFAQLMAATTFTNLTEAEVIANTPKACAAIPCPTFNDTRLNVAVTCLTGSFLQLRGYPELVARWGRGAMVAHGHRLNRAVIAALVTAAGAATVVATPAGDPSTSAILSAVELAATDIRYREGLADDAVIEIVLPRWVLASLRADQTRRAFGDPGTTDAVLMAWFTARNVRPQFVRDWQDFWGGVVAPSVGSGAPYVTSFPTTVQFLAFPAGSVVMLRQDVITLRNVYDSTNLAQNLYTELFFEEGWNLIYPCAGLRLYTALNCPSGATGLPIDLDCTP